MRLFFALEMPGEVRAALAGLIEGLRARARGVRWVDPHGVHLTLRFLGETDPARLPDLLAAARRVAATRTPLRLRTGGLGTFPDRGRPRVAWVAIEDEGGGLSDLQAALEGALEAAGWGREARPFSPHLTLGRVREGADPRLAILQATPPQPVSFETDHFALIESQLSPGGARYEARARFPLGEAK